tara:strand:- start:535 stop:708 length:174 start_codon:yes stop_codon:yes gene_type:complete
MAIYKLKKSESQSEASSVLLDTGGEITLSIPLNDPTNTDYQEYKAWCDAGGVPDPVS